MRLLIAGAGGHAKVVIDAAVACGFEIAGVMGKPGGATTLLGYPVTDDATAVQADCFVAAIGDNAARAAEFERLSATGMRPASVIHPSAVIAPGVHVGVGAFVAAGVVINVDAHIGENSILNTGCTIDHDCEIGDHVLVGPGSSLSGGVVVGTGTLLGVGTSIVPLARVGEWSVVGAGAAVTSDLPSLAVCVGVPARVVRTLGGLQ